MKNYFENVIGYEDVKDKLTIVIDIINNEEKYKKLGASVPRNIMIVGMPGIGKTLIAESFMNACNRNKFIIRKNKSGSGFIDEIKKVFDEAIEKGPSIILLDDLDKFSNEDAKRCDTEEYVTIQTCIDNEKNKNVFVIATVNNIRKLPESLVRNGRFDMRLDMDVPCDEDNAKIIKYYLKNKNLDENANVDLITNVLIGCTCANIESILNNAAVISAYNNKESIGENEIIMSFINPYTGVRDNRMEEKKYSSYDDDEFIKDGEGTNKMIVAYHEAGHILSSLMLDANKFILAYVEKTHNNNYEGKTRYKKGKHNGYSFQGKYSEIMVNLAGKAAIELKYGKKDIGCGEDIFRSYDTAESLVCKLGCFGIDKIIDVDSYHKYERDNDNIRKVLEDAYNDVKKIIFENMDLLDKIAEALFSKPYITYLDVEKIKS